LTQYYSITQSTKLTKFSDRQQQWADDVYLQTEKKCNK